MRKTKDLIVPSTGDAWKGNRDSGKVFRITEMPAAQAEKFAMRAFLLLKGSGQSIPLSAESLGFVGLAIVGLNVFLQANVITADLEALMDEMFTCVQIVRDRQNHPEVATPIVSDDDIEEVKTRLWLRGEIISLHTGFSFADVASNWWGQVTSAMQNLPNT